MGDCIAEAVGEDQFEGTDVIIGMATIGSDGPTGTFSGRHGVVNF